MNSRCFPRQISRTECTTIANRHSLASFTADPGIAGIFPSGNQFGPFQSQIRSPFFSPLILIARSLGNRHLGAETSPKSAGSGEQSHATAESRAILVQLDQGTHPKFREVPHFRKPTRESAIFWCGSSKGASSARSKPTGIRTAPFE